MVELTAVLAQDNASAGFGNVLIVLAAIVAVAVGLALYFVPTIVVIVKKHPQRNAIIALNILLGWSFIGWVGALVWALMVPTDAMADGPNRRLS